MLGRKSVRANQQANGGTIPWDRNVDPPWIVGAGIARVRWGVVAAAVRVGRGERGAVVLSWVGRAERRSAGSRAAVFGPRGAARSERSAGALLSRPRTPSARQSVARDR